MPISSPEARTRLGRLVVEHRGRLSKEEASRRAKLNSITWTRVEEGLPVRPVSYAKVEQALGWPQGFCGDFLEGRVGEEALVVKEENLASRGAPPGFKVVPVMVPEALAEQVGAPGQLLMMVDLNATPEQIAVTAVQMVESYRRVRREGAG